MKRTIGLIGQVHKEGDMGGLCKSRSVSMLPYGCRYRLMDFTLSNMTNYGITSIAIYPGKKIRSTMDHIGTGQPWDLNRRFQGIFLFPPVTSDHYTLKFGEIGEYYSTVHFFKRSREKYIFFARPNILVKPDLDEAFDYFIKTNADITLLYYPLKDEKMEYLNTDKLHLNDDGTLLNLGINLGTENQFNMYLGMFFIKKDLFIKLLEDTLEKGDASTVEDMINNHKDKLLVNSFKYEGTMENVRNVSSYYRANMNLLRDEEYEKHFQKGARIYTKTKDEPSTIYLEHAHTRNILSANGCIINGEVEGSLLFRGVKIEEGALVRNSIIMQKSEIGKDAVVINAIVDKGVVIEDGVTIVGSAAQPYVIEKGMIITGDEG